MQKKDKPSNTQSSSHPVIRSSEHPRRRRLFPQTLAQSCDPILKPLYKKHGFAEQRILTEWPSIVGPELAAYSAPSKMSGERGKNAASVLHITVNAARALELQHMQPVILERINAYFGCQAVTALRLIQAPAGTFRKNAKAQPPRKPSTNNSFCAAAAKCDDPELREALLSLGAQLGGNT